MRQRGKSSVRSLRDDMVGQGLVVSLARPGGNTTGISILATELDGKRQWATKLEPRRTKTSLD